jgi:hypothetical protein
MKRFITPKRLFNISARSWKRSQRTIQSFNNSHKKPRITENAPSAPIYLAPEQRGFSSVGRASALQAECQRFESVNLHHSKKQKAESGKQKQVF